MKYIINNDASFQEIYAPELLEMEFAELIDFMKKLKEQLPVNSKAYFSIQEWPNGDNDFQIVIYNDTK